ncbi:MAG: flagellar basal body rod protein FlgB [Planctomycetota bacterium]
MQTEGRDLLMRLMSAATLRQDVIANNIASQNLPGYRRRDVVFEELLARELQSGAPRTELGSIAPEIVTDFETEPRADGNNVSAEEEASLMRENRIRFELYAAILRSRAFLTTQAIVNDR